MLIYSIFYHMNTFNCVVWNISNMDAVIEQLLVEIRERVCVRE